MDQSLFMGTTPINKETGAVKGTLVQINGESYYKIANHDQIRPFFMSVVSDTNHWMFIGSNGGLTAGRKNSEFALFPYYTDEKIIESNHVTGSHTLMRVGLGGKNYLWEPFSECLGGLYNTSRNLYKNIYGDKIIFEEINHDLNLTFKYSWKSSNLYGFVKHAELAYTGEQSVEIELLDGIRNILPYGVTTDLQNLRSNLVDAYKKNELLPETGLGIYALSAIIVDRAEPSEALKANVVWSAGLDTTTYLCSSVQLDKFRKSIPLLTETEVKGEKGAYYVNTKIRLEKGNSSDWYIVANVNQGPADVANLRHRLKNSQELLKDVKVDVQNGTENLIKLVASADGIQVSQDTLRTARHFSNVLYNIMRGGLFDYNYTLEKSDFLPYITKANKEVAKNQQELLKTLPEEISLQALRDIAEQSEDVNFKRLCIEYLPLKFSRRHGDPSRPWNKFSINTQSEIDGSKILDYEGNWRDIFQNWEALAHSYPDFIDGMIHKFLNASTFEGYNPYRVTKDGFDWEVIEPDDPWSYIGYWGDHQIIYLLKFLEFIEAYYPGRLSEYFTEELFVYANVPYKIKSYEAIVKDPKDTIEFNQDLDQEIHRRKAVLGADGALLHNNAGQVHHVNLAEKLLATTLAKCSNFIPDAGIWLNTQRPEWNDANNALVGNGVSMVTLYYLKRFFTFFNSFLDTVPTQEVRVSVELKTLFNSLLATLNLYKGFIANEINDKDRKKIVDALGKAGSNYRESIYNIGFAGEKATLKKEDILKFIKLMSDFADTTIEANKRADSLYHAYNLIEFDKEELKISYLSEMLEGQVAVLSSGYLSPGESLELLNALRSSALYRQDQDSYILYPDKDLPQFIAKSLIPESAVKSSNLLSKLAGDGNVEILERDLEGKYHFNGKFNNAAILGEALSALPERYQELVASDMEEVLAIYESVFDHKSFTGRSGTFFGYEGLGSIYWHMVSKLSLAVMETVKTASESKADQGIIEGLISHYHQINNGIGVHKNPALYGAFPTDPYSHTPAHRGAQQPGMTGQVKEDILSRTMELGVKVENGTLRFGRGYFSDSEFLNDRTEFEFVDYTGTFHKHELSVGSLGFTFCQVPIIYKHVEKQGVVVHFREQSPYESDTLHLNRELSRAIFARDGSIERIEVSLGNKIF